MALAAENLRADYGEGSPVLEGVDLALEPGRFLALAGPNGAGKSTLLRCLAGLHLPQAGRVLLDGRPLAAIPPRRRARILGYLPQEVGPAFPFTVAEAVALGARVAGHGRWFETRPGRECREAVRRALEQVDALDLEERLLGELSGGERRRVLVASVLAQEPRYLLLDEPAAMLDLHHQAWLFSLFRRFCREGLAVLCVTHDLNLAATFADEILILDRHVLRARGAPAEVLREELLHEVFGERLELLPRPGRAPAVLPR